MSLSKTRCFSIDPKCLKYVQILSLNDKTLDKFFIAFYLDNILVYKNSYLTELKPSFYLQTDCQVWHKAVATLGPASLRHSLQIGEFEPLLKSIGTSTDFQFKKNYFF